LLASFGSLLTLGAGLIAWGIFLLIVSRVLIGESEALRRNPRALLTREVWAEAVISPQGRIAAALFIAGAVSIASGIVTLLFGSATLWFAS